MYDDESLGDTLRILHQLLSDPKRTEITFASAAAGQGSQAAKEWHQFQRMVRSLMEEYGYIEDMKRPGTWRRAP